MKILTSALVIVMLVSGCSTVEEQGIHMKIVCAELRSKLPMWSVNDTDETLRQAAIFIATFKETCGL